MKQVSKAGDANEALIMVFYWGALMDVANGSQVRTVAQLAFLTARFKNVVLYHFENHPTDRWTPEHVVKFKERFPNVRLVSDTESMAVRVLNKLKKILILVFPKLASSVLRFRISALTPCYTQLCKDNPRIRYVVNYVDSLAQINGVACDKTIVETHDLRYFRRGINSGTSLVSIKNLLNLRYEVSALSAVQALVAITQNEAYFYRNTVQATKILYIPEYAPDDVVEELDTDGFTYDLLFAASGNNINVKGIEEFFVDHGDATRKFDVAICGKICERAEVQKIPKQFSNVHLLGYLDDGELHKTYARSKACLSPTEGTGLNIKLVEALRHRKPVFASESSMNGLGAGYESCVFPLDVVVMENLLGDTQQLDAAAKSAAEYYRRFSKSGDLEELAQVISEL